MFGGNMPYQDDFIKFLYSSGVLQFGKFTLKSGRVAPYFINTGAFITNEAMEKAGRAYAETIVSGNVPFDTLFGPAYKGIPLVVSTSVALFDCHERVCNYCFNRKEAKDHGEGGTIIGKKLVDGEKVLIIEDVITAGTAMRETVPLLYAQAKVEITGLVVLVDRMEVTNSGRSAVEDIKAEFGFPVYPIITILDIIKAIENEVIPGKEYLEDIKNYREQYGVKNS
jgi:orotate phosphoribosyltransferase